VSGRSLAGYVDAVGGEDGQHGADRQQSAAQPADGAAGQTASITYEQARDQLTEVVRRLEAGGLTLEQSLDLWERGERLAVICEQWLEGARTRLAAAMAARTADPADPGHQPEPANHG
jgi:exodeoxyribonuclease VII small subunit